MKKALLLWMVTLALGTCVQQATAQQKDSPPKYKVIIKEKGGEEQVYEYESLEELRSDPRLKGRSLPGFEELGDRFYIDGGAGDAPFLLRADKLRMQADSGAVHFFRKYLNLPEGEERADRLHPFREWVEGDSLQGESFHFFRSPAEGVHEERARVFLHRKMGKDHEALLKQLREEGVVLPNTKELMIYNFQQDTVMLREMPEEARRLLKEHKLISGEEERVMIFRFKEGMPVPPIPPVPPVAPGAEEAQVLRAPALQEDAAWLEEISVYPNPSNDQQLKVRFRSKTSGPVKLRLLDMAGKLVYEEQIADAALLHDKTIQLPPARKGMFLLQIKQGKNTYTHKILLN